MAQQQPQPNDNSFQRDNMTFSHHTKDRSTITQNGTLKGRNRGYKYRLLIGAFPDLEEHIMLKVKEFSWQKMMVVKW
jgi:hypothetical protein